MFLFEEVVMPPLMTAVDIGAMLLEGHVDPLERLNKIGRLNVIGFEPQPAECAKLNALALPGRRYLPYAIANGMRRSFYVTNTGMTSSLLKPNLRIAQLFNHLAELMQVDGNRECRHCSTGRCGRSPGSRVRSIENRYSGKRGRDTRACE